MATDTFTASIPVVQVTPGMTIKFEAISPTTGAAITGVTLTDVAIYALDENPQPDPIDPVPVFLSVPDSEPAITPGAN